MIKLIQDLKNIDDKSEKILADEVYQGLKNGTHDFQFDIDIGVLTMYVDNEQAVFKFSPSDDLINRLNSRLYKNRQAIIKELETKVVNKFTAPLKEL